MAYLDEVYLKRVNKYGFSIQERIQNKKIHEFEIFLKKSPNKVTIYKDAESSFGVLQNKTNSEKEVVDYLLTSKEEQWEDGTLLITEQIDETQKKWLIFHLDEYASIGYNRYQIIELDRTVQWIDEGIVYSEDVHFTGSGANLRDKSITSKFSIQYDISAMYIPNKILNLVMKTNSKMKKGIRILIGDEVWKVSGIDKISVPGVSYVTLEEDYIDEQDDIGIANSNKLADWNIQSSVGNEIILQDGDSESINFILYYNDLIREEPYQVIIKDKNIATYKRGVFTALAQGQTTCKISLINSPEIFREFPLQVAEVKTEQFVVIGPERVKTGEKIELSLIGDYIGVSFDSQNKNFVIETIAEDKIILRGKNIGKDMLLVTKNEKVIFKKNINVESIWMEG